MLNGNGSYKSIFGFKCRIDNWNLLHAQIFTQSFPGLKNQQIVFINYYN